MRIPGRSLGQALRPLAGLGLAVLLGGCAGGGLLGGDPASGSACPQVAVLEEPSELTRFAAASGGDLSGVLFRARMDLDDAFCEIDKKSVDVTVTAAFRVARGPANTSREARFSYFVAVLDSDKNIIHRSTFPIIAKFKKKETGFSFTEDFTVTIDVGKEREPSDYIVYLGFEMTPEELAFNRRRRRR